MSDISRRDALRRLALVLTATGTLDRIAAAEVHQIAAASQSSGGAYAPKSMTDAHFKTLERLTDLIIPVENGAPGAVAAGCAQWIDTISAENDQLKTIYRDGLTWLDTAMRERGAADFLSATAAQQMPGQAAAHLVERRQVVRRHIGIGDVDEIREAHAVRRAVVENDVEILRVHQAADDLVHRAQHVEHVATAVGLIGDRVKRALQAFGLFETRDRSLQHLDFEHGFDEFSRAVAGPPHDADFPFDRRAA